MSQAECLPCFRCLGLLRLALQGVVLHASLLPQLLGTPRHNLHRAGATRLQLGAASGFLLQLLRQLVVLLLHSLGQLLLEVCLLGRDHLLMRGFGLLRLPLGLGLYSLQGSFLAVVNLHLAGPRHLHEASVLAQLHGPALRQLPVGGQLLGLLQELAIDELVLQSCHGVHLRLRKLGVFVRRPKVPELGQGRRAVLVRTASTIGCPHDLQVFPGGHGIRALAMMLHELLHRQEEVVGFSFSPDRLLLFGLLLAVALVLGEDPGP
mmetsp:Transcript_76980/g.184432  ORF Transcript_76980/g.184432 Transcript_76980/m.184432 type:complete len:264 (+) Transcript_76980:2351-3142(+)